MVGLSAIACKDSITNPKPPTEFKTYSIEVKNTRVDVKSPQYLGVTPGIFLSIDGVDSWDFVSGNQVQKLDDYHFKGTFDGVSNYRKQKYAAGFYCIAVADRARYDGVDRGLEITGYKITITIVETGFSKEFVTAQTNTIHFGYENSNSTMIRFYLTSEGRPEDMPGY